MSDEERLNASDHELEIALRSLRPTPARIDSAAIAARHRSAPSRVRFWRVAAAILLLAGGAWAALTWRGQLQNAIERPAPVTGPVLAVEIESPVEPPTLLTYRRALFKSSGEMNSLLDRHASMGSSPDASLTIVTMLTLGKTDSHSELGEM